MLPVLSDIVREDIGLQQADILGTGIPYGKTHDCFNSSWRSQVQILNCKRTNVHSVFVYAYRPIYKELQIKIVVVVNLSNII